MSAAGNRRAIFRFDERRTADRLMKLMEGPAAAVGNRVHPNLDGGQSAQALGVVAKQGRCFRT